MDPKRVRNRSKAEVAFRMAMLPEDVVEEILLRLPAKSVARFRAVSKSWHGLLRDRVFLRAHHDHASRAVLLRHRCEDDSFLSWDVAIHKLPFGQQAATALPLEKDKHRQLILHGCCDGLLLLSDHPNYFLVYNPTTREHVTLPRGLHYDLAVAGFYLHAPTAEYRVLCYVCYRTERVPRREVEMVTRKHYHPREREMVTRKHYNYSVVAVGRPEVRRLASTTYGGYTRWKLNDAPVILRGCLHWMRKFHRVVVFDTVSEKFRAMRGPLQDRYMIGRLVALDGTLGASSFAEGERTVDVWVLLDYDKATWTLRYRVDVGFLGGDLKFKWLGIAHVTKAGDALFYGARRYGVYNLRKREVVSAGREIVARLTATWHIYAESLVSLAPNKDVSADNASLEQNYLKWIHEPLFMESL